MCLSENIGSAIESKLFDCFQEMGFRFKAEYLFLKYRVGFDLTKMYCDSKYTSFNTAQT